MNDMQLLHIPEHWQTNRDELWQRHLSGLNEAYFSHGAEQLERLRLWSRGRKHDYID